jgi:hypothetical protein
MWLILLGAVVAVVVLIAYLQHRAQRGVYRTLASRQPPRRKKEKAPLGMEAIDLNAVARTTRKNESLERGTTNWMRSRMGFFGSHADVNIEPLADDESYAARYYAAFQKDRKKDD